MQRKLICVFIIWTLVLIIYDFSVAAERNKTSYPSDQIGRYQLIQGKLSTPGSFGETISVDATFKLDTVTGKLYICYVTQSLQLNERGNFVMIRSCKDFEQVWEMAPQPARK